MSDRPKTLNSWFFPHQARIAKALNMPEFTTVPGFVEDAWNARDALAKEEIEAVRTKMQAEIDKRDELIKISKTIIDGLEEFARLEGYEHHDSDTEIFLKNFEELNQRGER